MRRSSIGVILSFNGGYVDTMGFLAFAGLFPSHITGNFVTLAAAIVTGSSGILAKILALPLFCVVVFLARIAVLCLGLEANIATRMLLVLKLALFVAVAAAIFALGRVPHGDSSVGIALGLTLVTAMAIQNALHRVHLSDFPPSTLMTGTTTQIMLDLGDLVSGKAGDRKPDLLRRLRRFSSAFFAFAIGCAAAALLYSQAPIWCFAVPPLVVLAGLIDRLVLTAQDGVP